MNFRMQTVPNALNNPVETAESAAGRPESNRSSIGNPFPFQILQRERSNPSRENLGAVFHLCMFRRTGE